MPKNLREYVDLFVSMKVLDYRPPADAIISNHAGVKDPAAQVTSVILDRRGHFQAELCVVLENVGKVEDHVHPGVDSLLLPVAGSFVLNVRGQDFPFDCDGRSLIDYTAVFVTEKDCHHFTAFEKGACFINVQHWKDGTPPTSIGHKFKHQGE